MIFVEEEFVELAETDENDRNGGWGNRSRRFSVIMLCGVGEDWKGSDGMEIREF